MQSQEKDDSKTGPKLPESQRLLVVALAATTVLVFAVVGVVLVGEMRATSSVRTPNIAPSSAATLTADEAQRIGEEKKVSEAKRAAYENDLAEARIRYDKEKQQRLMELKRWSEVLQKARLGQRNDVRDNTYVQEMTASNIAEVQQLGHAFNVMRGTCGVQEQSHQQACAIAVRRAQDLEARIEAEVRALK